ncbi:transcription factor 24-like [Scleropages formosus]|uniref:transcription factor 24-like n=1 Tax=Scleropages formosus TaxID=113540 RepID=UPI0010FA73CE|nr:transcription factor 24-like [Scleropages formosus]
MIAKCELRTVPRTRAYKDPLRRERQTRRRGSSQEDVRSARAGGGRPAGANAARERSRVQTLRLAFLELQRTLPSVPPDTKLSKLDVLLLATTYIAHLTRTLQEGDVGGQGSARQCDVLRSVRAEGYLHPVKKWPMRTRLYTGATGQFMNSSGQTESSSQSQSSSTPHT